MKDVCSASVSESSGSIKERNSKIMKIIKRYSGLIHQTCVRYSMLSPTVDMEDLKQEADLGLVEALCKVDRGLNTMTEARITTIITGRMKKFLGQMFKDQNMVVVLENPDAAEKIMSYQQFQKIKRKLPSTATHSVQRRVVSINEGRQEWDDSTSRKQEEIVVVG